AATTTDIERLALDAQLVRETLRFDVRGRFGPDGSAGGQLDLTGSVQPFAEPLVYEISEGRATQLDLAALTGDPAQASSITGTFTLDARGTDPQAMLLDLEARLDDTRYGTTAIPSADLFATLGDGLLAFDGEADFADAGQVALRGETAPFADTLRYDADVLLTNLDAGAFVPPDSTGAAPLATRLNGTLRLTGAGTDPQTLALSALAQLSGSQVNDQAITSGNVVMRLTDGRLDADVTMTLPGGLVRLDATGTPFAETPAFTVRDGRFEHLNVGAFAGDSTLASDLTGTFTAEAVGTDPATARVDATLQLEPSTFNDATLDGTVVLALADGVGQADAALALAGGTADVDATYRVPTDGTVPSFEARGDIDDVDLRPFLAPILAALPDTVRAANPRLGQRDALSLNFDVTGQGDSPETIQARGRVWSRGVRALDIHIDSLFAAFALGDERLDLTTLFLRSEVLDLRAGGEVALDAFTATNSLLTLTAQVKDPAPLSRLVGQPLLIEEGRIEGQVQSEPGEPLQFRLDATTDLFAVGGTRASDLNADVAGLYSRDEGLATRVRFETGFLSAGTFRARDVDADARYDGDEVSVDVTLEVDDERDVRLQGRTALDPAAPQFTLDRFDVKLGQRRFRLAQPSRISFGDRIRVRGFLLAADTPGLGTEQIAADGVIDLDGRQNFILTVEGLLLDGLTDLAGLDALGGRLDASLVMGGTASAPTLDGTFAVGPITSRKSDVGTVDAAFSYAAQRFDIDAALTHVSGAALRATGFAPIGFALDGTLATPPADAPVDLALTTTEPFPIAWATPFFDPRTVNELGGTLTADAAVVGTRSSPQLDGTLAILDGRMGLPEFGRVYANATLPITLDDDRLTFGSDVFGPALLRDGDGGTLTLEGSLLVPDLQVAALDLDLLIQANRYLAIDNQTYSGFRVSASGSEGLRVTGPVDGPTVTGTVQIDQGVVNQTDELIGPTFSQISLSPTDIQRVEATFGVRASAADTTVSAVYVDTAIDLRVIVPGRVRFRADGLANIDLEFEGDLIVRKERGQEEVQLFDSIEIPRGTVEFGGRRFEVERGVFIFNGPVPETRVDLEAAMVIRQTGETSSQSALTITLNYEGTLAENPAPSFASSPVQLETSEIVCYIATGQPCAGIVSGAGDSAMGLAAAQLSAAIGNVAGRSLGLDLVQIEARPDITVTIGKYLSNRLFATLGYLVSNNSGSTDAATLDLVLQYQLRQWLQLQAEYEQLQDGENNVGGGVQFEVAY
ncbi:MAG: translocation/assembly module TamB domain-containing protein, partial [Bacteroidota bacterium]